MRVQEVDPDNSSFNCRTSAGDNFDMQVKSLTIPQLHAQYCLPRKSQLSSQFLAHRLHTRKITIRILSDLQDTRNIFGRK